MNNNHSSLFRFMLSVLALLLLAFQTTLPASAQIKSSVPALAWSSYNSQFLFTYSPGQKGFSMTNGGDHSTGFWEDIEEIEVAEDAYEWAARTDPNSDTTSYIREIDELCSGLAAHNKFAAPNNAWYIKNKFNDDLTWAAAAFTRAYQITGNKEWLSAAETNFTAVWTRGRLSDGGLIQIQGGRNEDSPVNFGFVIAGRLLYEATGNSSYKTEADSVYQWSMTNLYKPEVNDGVCAGHPDIKCVKIYDSTTGHADFSYNYGIAIQAAVREGDQEAAQRIANWLMFNFRNAAHPYAGTYKGYNILPDWGVGGTNNDGYNGIAMRGIGYGLQHAAFNATTLAWAQANLASAWNHRTHTNVMEGNWATDYKGATTYAWDCSSAVAGLLDIPSPL